MDGVSPTMVKILRNSRWGERSFQPSLQLRLRSRKTMLGHGLRREHVLLPAAPLTL